MNYIRALLSSGFADLHNPRSWQLSHVRNEELAKAFDSIIERLEDSLDFLKVVGGESGALQTVDIWTSHEVIAIYYLFCFLCKLYSGCAFIQGLMLEFEEALTRTYQHEGNNYWYNTSAFVV